MENKTKTAPEIYPLLTPENQARLLDFAVRVRGGELDGQLASVAPVTTARK